MYTVWINRPSRMSSASSLVVTKEELAMLIGYGCWQRLTVFVDGKQVCLRKRSRKGRISQK
jgi:hypothetical protein